MITIPKPSLTIELHTCKAYADLEVYVARMVRGVVVLKYLKGTSGIFLPYPSPLKKKSWTRACKGYFKLDANTCIITKKQDWDWRQSSSILSELWTTSLPVSSVLPLDVNDWLSSIDRRSCSFYKEKKIIIILKANLINRMFKDIFTQNRCRITTVAMKLSTCL